MEEERITLWVRVSGTIDVPKSLVRKMIEEGKDWIEEFNGIPFERDFSDDYCPESEIAKASSCL